MAAVCSLLLIIFLGLCGLWGSALMAVARAKRHRAIGIFFGPVVGLAILVHTATAMGWTIGFPRGITAVSLVSLTTLSSIALWRSSPRLEAFTAAAFAASMAGGWSLLAVLLRYHAFNPFHDAFTYLFHSQWLQEHPFFQSVSATAAHPALSQIALYQSSQLRMGASFVLAWIQSLTGVDSLQAYPPAIALPLSCGVLALAGATWSVLRGHRYWCLALGLLPALTLNGVTFAVSNGFLPQSFGLVFAMAALVLAAQGGRAAIPAAVCLSAQVYCYPEALPFTLVGFLPLSWMRSTRRCALAALGLGAILATPELGRALSGFIIQAGSAVGINSPITPVEALAHATGFFSGTFSDRTLLLIAPGPTLAVCLLLLALTAAGLRYARVNSTIAAFGTVMIAQIIAWAAFRWLEVNPWDGTRGNPWRQARAASWAAYPALALISMGLGLLWKYRRDARIGLALLLGCWLGAGALRHWTIAGLRIAPLQAGLQCSGDCFEKSADLKRAASRIPPQDAIGLAGFQQGRGKAQQFLSLVLFDRTLIADWREDDYIAPYLRSEDVTSDPARAQWLVAGRRPLQLLPASQATYMLGVAGGYPEEFDSQGWWHWTDRSIRFDYRLPKDCRAIRVTFSTHALKPRTVVARLNGRETARISVEPMEQHSFTWPLGDSGTAQITFESEEPPAPAQGADARRLSFLIRNLTVDPIAKP